MDLNLHVPTKQHVPLENGSQHVSKMKQKNAHFQRGKQKGTLQCVSITNSNKRFLLKKRRAVVIAARYTL
jgi:hypothetical protein